MTDTTTHPGVIARFGTMAEAEAAIRELGAGAPRIARCGEYGSARTHFLVWPATAGVTLRNMTCPVHGRQHVTQTVHGTAGVAWAISKAHVKALADEANAAKAAKTAAAEAAGDVKMVKALAPGDVFVYAPKGYRATELPSHACLRVVEAERLPGGKVRLVVVGSAAAFTARQGAYAVRTYGIESDLATIEPLITATITGTAVVRTTPTTRYTASAELTEALAGELTWADEVDVNASELDRLSRIAQARARYIETAKAELAKAEARRDAPGFGTAMTDEQAARARSNLNGDIIRRRDTLDRFHEELARIEARLDELAAAISTPAIAEPEECDHVGTGRVDRTAHGFLNDAPAGTVERLCVACGTVLASTDGDGEVVGIVLGTPEPELGEEDTWPASVCANCLAENGEPITVGADIVDRTVVTYDEAAGRRLCQECEPCPMVDGIRPGDAVRIDPKAGANGGREAVVVRHEANGSVVQVLGQGIERLYHRSELTPAGR